MAFHPYRFFSGTCREAFTRYHEIFGGDLVLMPLSEAPPGEDVPAGADDMIMHAALTFDGHLLMASDDPTGTAGQVLGLAINFSTPEVAEAERVFTALAEGGEIQMPLAPQLWSPAFGTCVDRFGTPWMVSADPVDR